MKKSLVVAMLSLLSVSACVDGSTHKYPAAVADNFISSCEKNSGGQKQACTCLFEKVQEKYTYDEFSALEGQIKDNKPPAEFSEFVEKVRTECAPK